ncbi:MAG: thioredoxin [Erysipelotrichaceae bacterium]|nr:thioredoxin [Erysipelotrichaceae bacterium]MBQ1522790.1 thioredoxin [Erysipelotrichaceae bacterium]
MEIINTNNFAEKTKEGLVLVDFFADWCGPCKMLAPVLEKLAGFYGDKLTVYKVNVDNDIDIARQFNVVSIPSLFLLKDGQVVNQTMGFQNLESLKNFVESGL